MQKLEELPAYKRYLASNPVELQIELTPDVRDTSSELHTSLNYM